MPLFDNQEHPDLALQWALYGGPPASVVFVKFGLRPHQYNRALADLFDTTEMSATDRAALAPHIERISDDLRRRQPSS